ncbi:MAG: diaminopimelate decarboxylase [Zhenhengia sp.]|jgi:diaminopimelate decarboxylase|uniref:diaminopimelate decarboxylase n=1 Tax=Zhenhengia sp. TaxID=2944208 RepID=UPI002913B803|nr:diaminopimelate decarboxylase [Clostridiales bacterium]MDU6974111.1 diaminopimelate decarboxylase [Clostridiales bacterium]
MYTLHGIYTENTSFFKGNDPFDLITEYGSPLYVYNEEILRTRCREIKNLVTYENFVPHYSIKSNTNIHLLKIVHEEGLHADVMSPGEIYLALESGFTPEELFYIPNNATPCDMRYAIERGILTSVDSLSQLEMYGTLNPSGKVAIRFNPGIGAGHHEKVVTAGKKTKFGVNPEDIDKVNLLLEKYNLTLIGINQHIGSLFMNADPYIQSTSFILEFAKQFDSLEFIDLGGGFGIPYHKQEGEARLDMQALGTKLDEVLHSFAADYGKKIQFQIEPGRYIPCESGIVLGTVTSLKSNGGIHYMGTDIGFNVLQRPIMYGSHHDIELYSQDSLPSHTLTPFTVVGNICESGDILAKDRVLPTPHIGDLIGIMDAGAYGFCMSSSYNQRPRCTEVLIESTGAIRLIRKRETFEDLIRNMLV